MPFVNCGELEYYYLENLQRAGVEHGFFTRKGGISPKPFDTLNLASTVGDTRDNIIENRMRIFNVFDSPVESIFDVWQVHSDRIMISEEPRPLASDHEKADAIVTSNPNVTLFMRFADCVPIMLYDPKSGVGAIVHAGWKGTVDKILTKTVLKIREHYGSKDMIAGIGPSIGPCHYEVGKEVIQQVEKAFPKMANELISEANHFDLWKANQVQLEELGISNIQVAEVCTACDTSRWFSHRAEKGKTGRFGAIMVLPGVLNEK
ncbi:MAG TPA: peptidoglycan editing factor PgeF [Bellilinea sp.]|nr:peptidoglycan editing factor PgeF [Bellilinea sp.]